jgi:AIPR protein
MSKLGSFTFPVVSFRNLETPYQKDYRDYFAIVDTTQLPDLSEWLEINARGQKLTGYVPDKIRQSFNDSPDMFVFRNRGLAIAVDKVTYDNKSSLVTMKLTNPQLHGLLDGGHSYRVVTSESNLTRPRYVRVEFLEGFDHDEITDLVDARNTSNQVKLQSLMNLAGEFQKLKDALKGSIYTELIAFKEFEFDSDGNQLPIDVREVVALLTLFDREHFSPNNHPIMAYNSKAACLDHFSRYPSSYRKIYPLAKEILPLYDHIRDRLPDFYNTARAETGTVTGGKFGRLTGVTTYKGKRVQHLNYIDKDSRYGIPDGFTYPILAGFRALLEEKNGRYVWGRGLDPLVLFDGELGKRLADTIGNIALQTQNPSKTGKTPLVWQSCYQAVQLAYLMAGQK